MTTIDLKDVAKLSKDLYYDKNKQFGEVSGDQVFRNMIFDVLGAQPGEAIDFYKWKENQNKVFEIVSIAVDSIVPTVLTNELDNLAEVRNLAIGDEAKFDFEDDSLFRVGLVASGDRDLRRQELHGGSFTVSTDWYGVKVYAEFEKFLAGHVNWRGYIDRIAKSFANHLQSKIAEAFVTSYDALRASRKQTGAFDKDELINIARHVRVASGGKQVAVYGSESALAKISDHALLSEKAKDQMNEIGRVGKIAGLDLIALPDAYKAGTEEFALDSDSLLILPVNEKLVSVVLEGQTLAQEVSSEKRNDMQIEFETLKKLGVQVAQAAVYGMYRMA